MDTSVCKLADRRVNRVEDVVKMGDMIWGKVLGVDERGKIKLSRKAAMTERGEAAGGTPAAPAPAPVGIPSVPEHHQVTPKRRFP